VRQRPGDRGAGKIGRPDAPRRGNAEIGRCQRLEQQHRNGDGEDEIGQALADILP
jgi:hypothetical protein